MKEMYTTGQVASQCGVSVRTVQFYDEKGIVKPSCMSENGRRLYMKEDLERFQLVCLYKKLGLSLNKIKEILGSHEPYLYLLDTLNHHYQEINDEIKKLYQQKEVYALLIDEIKTKQCLPVLSEQELDQLVSNKKKYHHLSLMTSGLIIVFSLFVIVGSFLMGYFNKFGGWFIGLIILLLILLVLFHSKTNVYVCPHCHQKFSIGFFKDLMTLNNGKKGKYLKCPYCHQSHWMKETFREH